MGGLRDRLIIISFRRMLHDALDALGWFSNQPDHDPYVDRYHDPINWAPYPTPRDQEIPYNTCAITFEDDVLEEAELGTTSTTRTTVAYVDFYAEPPPSEGGKGGESLGKHFIGDVCGILAGEFPDIGRAAPILDVYDYDLATPEVIFTVEFPVDRLETHKANTYDQPWERWWYSCIVHIEDYRQATVEAGYAGGYAGGY